MPALATVDVATGYASFACQRDSEGRLTLHGIPVATGADGTLYATPSNVARLLGVSRRTVYGWMAAGRVTWSQLSAKKRLVRLDTVLPHVEGRGR